MSEIGAAVYSTIAERVKKISDGVINRNRLLSYMNDNGCMMYNKGGAEIRGPFRYTASAIAGYTNDLGVGGAQTTQTFVEYAFNWRQFLGRPFILEFQEERNQNASQVAKVFTMAKAQLDEVRQAASARIGRASYAADTTTESVDTGTPINGLEGIIANTGTYGGLSRTTYSAWQAQIQAVTNPSQDDNSNGVTNRVEGMNTLYLNCSAGKGIDGDGIKDNVATEKEETDHIITTQTLYNTYKNALMPQQRYSGRSGSDLTSLLFGIAEVEWDPACTAARMYFLNKNYLEFWCVNSKLLMAKDPIRSGSPLGTMYPISGQHCLYSRNPRYLGAVQTTGS